MIFVREIKMPLTIRAFTIPDANGDFNIYINEDLSDAAKRKSLIHEENHIKRNDIRAIGIIAAKKAGAAVIFSFGAHVIKNNLSRFVIALIKEGYITHISGNGACSIHDFELCYNGGTSEDVPTAIEDGSFGMWEETMAFYPLLLPVFIAAGYDSITAVSVIMLGAGVGTLCSTVNPFATGIASGFAGISLGDGLLLRLLMLLVLEAVAITFVMRYATKVYTNPRASIVADQFEENKKRFAINFDDTESMTLAGKRKTALIIFAGTFLLMIYSVIPFSDLGITFLPTLGWYFTELSGLFLVAGIIVGVATRMREQELIEGFVRGASDLLGVAFIIAISRGITVIMNSGFITDTILNWGEMALSGANSILFILLTYLLYLPLSFLIPSSSGLATLSIPIMVPLGEFTNISSALIITAFQSASGLVNLLTPTRAVVMGGLAVAHIPYDRWLKYVIKLVVIVLLLTMAFLAAGALL